MRRILQEQPVREGGILSLLDSFVLIYVLLFFLLGCEDLGAIEHGWHNLLSDDPKQVESQIWLPGTKITYTCEEGMRLKGQASHVCTKSGWKSGIKPECERSK